MKVKDYRTTEPATVNIDATFHDVKEKMVEEGTSVVLIKAGAEIVGVVTDTDVFAHSAAGKDLNATKVKKHMTACELGGVNPCLQIFEDSPVEDAVRIMAISGVHHLLVWGKDGHLSGVISSKNILKTVD
ncbi:MAG: CBS domain-containing protein [Candidatus Hydrothermarchaeaceae archaeon]